jgi:hypothetical protein
MAVTIKTKEPRRMASTTYGERYTNLDKFINLCKELGIDDVDEEKLELFEKKKFLFPVRRLLLDSEFLKYMWPIKNDPSNPYYHKPSFPLPNKWKKQYEVYTDTKDWVSVWTYHKVFHPLDKGNEPHFIKHPPFAQYRRWDGYKFKVGSYPNFDCYESRAVHIYSYWQVYVVFDILSASKIELYFDLTKREAIESLVSHRKIPKKFVFNIRWPYSPVRKSGDFTGRNSDFESLSFYVNAIQRVEKLAYSVWTRGKGKLNLDEAYQLVLRNAIRIALCEVF